MADDPAPSVGKLMQVKFADQHGAGLPESARHLRVFDGDGGFIDAFGPHESGFGLAISDNNEIYAAFATRHVIRKYALQKP